MTEKTGLLTQAGMEALFPKNEALPKVVELEAEPLELEDAEPPKPLALEDAEPPKPPEQMSEEELAKLAAGCTAPAPTTKD